MRAKRCEALNGIRHLCFLFRGRRGGGCRGSGLRLLRFAAVTLEGSRGGELTEPMANHVFGNKDFDMRLSVMNHERQSDEFRYDGASPRPGFDRLFRTAGLGGLHFLEDLEIDERTFFAAAAHDFSISIAGT